MVTQPTKSSKRNFWLSFIHTEEMGAYTLYWPWWVSGSRISDDARTVCVAIQATDDDAAKQMIFDAFDARPTAIEFRFLNEQPDDWSPFNGRFRRASWMAWPNETHP